MMSSTTFSIVLKNLFPSWRFFDFPGHEIIIWVKDESKTRWQKLSLEYQRDSLPIISNSQRMLFHWLNVKIEKYFIENSFEQKSNLQTIEQAIAFLYKSKNTNANTLNYKVEIIDTQDLTLHFNYLGTIDLKLLDLK